uniref:3-ketoacyl-[acyl-carrier-protein] reductase beta subunit n=1 Tax=Monodon monoceros TaxID=40151 RepID=A0A8C6FCW2_MONMO
MPSYVCLPLHTVLKCTFVFGAPTSPSGGRGHLYRNVTDGFTEVMRSWAAGDHLALSCDVAKEHDVQNTFEEIEKNLGQVNFLVNAAGINRDNLLVRTNAEDMLSQLHTNLLGSVLTCRAAYCGCKGQSGQSVYSASKGGLAAFSRALAKEVARKKIRANVVAPGHYILLNKNLWGIAGRVCLCFTMSGPSAGRLGGWGQDSHKISVTYRLTVDRRPCLGSLTTWWPEAKSK